jgi:hypothetical protein
MTSDQFNAIIKMLPVSENAEGWLTVPQDQLLSLYSAHNGVALHVAKIEKLRIDGSLVHTRTHRGEQYVLILDDVFAMAADAPSSVARKAGFGAE